MSYNFNLLFLPLLGGYFFFVRFNGTRYRASAFQPQRIIFPAGLLGLVFLVIAREIIVSIPFVHRNEVGWNNLLLGVVLPCAAFNCLVAMAIAAFADRRKFESYLKQQKHTIGQVVSLGPACLVILGAGLEPDLVVGFPWVTLLGAYLILALATGAIACGVTLTTSWRISGSLFRASVAILVVVGLAATLPAQAAGIQHWWSHFSAPLHSTPLHSLDSGTALFSFAVGVGSVVVGNLVISPLAAAAFQHFQGTTTEFDKLLFTALNEMHLLSITLDCETVYVGLITSLPPQTQDAGGFVSITPLMIGYRTAETKVVEFNQFYDEIISELLEEYRETPEILRAQLREFSKVIPQNDIKIAGRFDYDDYVRSQQEKQGGGAPQNSQSPEGTGTGAPECDPPPAGRADAATGDDLAQGREAPAGPGDPGPPADRTEDNGRD